MRFLFNASNLHFGGGVQVATSVIYEISLTQEHARQIHVLVSSVVNDNLQSCNVNINSFASYHVVDLYGFSALWKAPSSLFKGYDAVFTVFGPLYSMNPPLRSVVGFAQPWILYPDNEISHQLGFLERSKLKIKFWIQSLFFSRADILVVELDHVRNGLVNAGISTNSKIRVVHNTLASIYSNPSLWKELYIPASNASIRLGFLGRNYSHKNTAIFPDVHKHLKINHGIDVVFYVTFTDEEWMACSPHFRQLCINVGALDVSQCPLFYQAMDGVIFPSLLECFSATPLEAMAMKKPLFASDRSFISDVCGPYANYFDPTDPSSIAASIAKFFNSDYDYSSQLESAAKYAHDFSSAKQRAKDYLACLYEVVEIKSHN